MPSPAISPSHRQLSPSRLTLLALLAACSKRPVSGDGKGGDEGDGDPPICEGLPALIEGITGGDEELEISSPDGECEDGRWRLDAYIDDDIPPPDRITAATWNLKTQAFGAATWELAPDGDRTWAAEISVEDAGMACDSAPMTLFVLFPWWGSTLGEVEILRRGAVEGELLVTTEDRDFFHIDTVPGTADEGAALGCETGSGSRAHKLEMDAEMDDGEEEWSAEWYRVGPGEGWIVLAAGLLTLDGEPVAAAGEASE